MIKRASIRTPLRRAALAAMAALLAVACASTTQEGTVGVRRSQLMMVSSGEMNQGAVQAYSQVLKDAQAKGILNRDPAQTARVRAIATRLIPQTKVFRNDAPGWQ